MNPQGIFRGNTFLAEWTAVQNAKNYSVTVEQCNDSNVCHQVFSKVQGETFLSSTSSDFEACSTYNLKVVAVGPNFEELYKETSLLKKSQSECDRTLELTLIATISAAAVVFVILLGVCLYLNRKKPFQKIQRARSRVYSKLYPREKYIRPYRKDDFLNELSNLQPRGFFAKNLSESNGDLADGLNLSLDLMERNLPSKTVGVNPNFGSDFFGDEFFELEEIALNTIQRRTEISLAPSNRKRNRYQDIVPFDATRVILRKPIKLEGETDASDYINASYITDISTCPTTSIMPINSRRSPSETDRLSKWNIFTKMFRKRSLSKSSQDTPARFRMTKLALQGSDQLLFERPVKYIAAQGPSEDTTILFWEMIWQENVRVIVMLTNLVEGMGFNSIKCAMYWPELIGGTKRFNDLKVQLYDIQDAPEYRIHKLEISRRSETVCREIIHIQCTSWPDRSAPDDPNSLLQLLEVTNAMHSEHKDKKEDVSILVHCSAGVGRTGTFIAVDQLLRMADNPSFQEIDIFNLVYQLRKDRRFMVQTKSQYEYVYKCLYEYMRRKQQNVDIEH